MYPEDSGEDLPQQNQEEGDFNIDLGTSDVMGPPGSSFSPDACYTWPSQGFFPQNTYTFYPCSIAGTGYQPKQIPGFFDPNGWTHAVDVLTKFATFAGICYPLLASEGR